MLTLTKAEGAIVNLLYDTTLGLTDDGWVLLGMDEHEPTKDGWKSPLYRALRRRGFDVRMRQVEGGYETWARWPEED